MLLSKIKFSNKTSAKYKQKFITRFIMYKFNKKILDKLYLQYTIITIKFTIN